MNAGRELDALIATKVFGGYLYGQAVVRDTPPPDWDGFVIDTLPQGYYWSIPAYSTDIAAAWELVEKMHQLGKPVDLGLEYMTAQEAALAICLAALKVVGVTVEAEK